MDAALPRMPRVSPLLFALALVLVTLPLVSPAAAAVDFGRDVRPILSENCYQCHGQDAAARKGRLRLDTREGQQKEGVIVPGKPDDSDLIVRIFSQDDEEKMPPPDSHRTLTD